MEVTPITDLSFIKKGILFSELSRIAYFSGTKLENECQNLGIQVPAEISKEGAQCLIFLWRYDIIISFRGTDTESLNDFKANLQYQKVPTTSGQYGYVHKGFLQETEKLRLLMPPFSVDKRNFWLCGHSLGGAIATIMATYVYPKEIYTFGSPMVADKKWVDVNKFIHHRVVNNNDIIAHIPKNGYVHHGTEHYLNYYGEFCTMTKSRRWLDYLLSRFSAYRKFEFFEPVYDHKIGRYIKKLKKMDGVRNLEEKTSGTLLLG